jgi:hypothetical protein
MFSPVFCIFSLDLMEPNTAPYWAPSNCTGAM